MYIDDSDKLECSISDVFTCFTFILLKILNSQITQVEIEVQVASILHF